MKVFYVSLISPVCIHAICCECSLHFEILTRIHTVLIRLHKSWHVILTYQILIINWDANIVLKFLLNQLRIHASYWTTQAPTAYFKTLKVVLTSLLSVNFHVEAEVFCLFVFFFNSFFSFESSRLRGKVVIQGSGGPKCRRRR